MIIVVDVETSGLDPNKNGLLSIGAVVYEEPEKIFYEECCLRDSAEVNPKALEINGFDEQEIKNKNKQTEKDLILHFAKWWEGIDEGENILAGHNAHFDFGFIRAALVRHDVKLSISSRILDQHSVCLAHMVKHGKVIKEINSDFVMTYVGLPVEPKPHNALNGALWETEALGRLIEGVNKLEQFASYPIPTELRQ